MYSKLLLKVLVKNEEAMRKIIEKDKIHFYDLKRKLINSTSSMVSLFLFKKDIKVIAKIIVKFSFTVLNHNRT